MPNISSVIKAIQDIMRKDTGVDGDAQRLSQIVWMLFLKIFADKEVEAEIIDDNYKSPIAEKYRWQNWAKDDSSGRAGRCATHHLHQSRSRPQGT